MPKTKAIAETNDSVSDTNIDTIYINNYPKTLCRVREGNNRPFWSVSFQLPDSWASFIMPPDFVRKSRRKDGTNIEECLNIALGNADSKRTVSVAREDGDGFENVEMSNKEIFDAITLSREKYLQKNA